MKKEYTIDVLIAELEELKAKHGNIPVYIDHGSATDPIEFLDVDEAEEALRVVIY